MLDHRWAFGIFLLSISHTPESRANRPLVCRNGLFLRYGAELCPYRVPLRDENRPSVDLLAPDALHVLYLYQIQLEEDDIIAGL